MDKRIEDIVNDTANKLNAVIQDNKNISFMVIAIDCDKAHDDGTRRIKTAAKCGGTVGALAAGLIATAVQTKGGQQVYHSIMDIMETGSFDFEKIEENEN